MVDNDGSNIKPGLQRNRLVKEFSPLSNNVENPPLLSKQINVLICTDADGVGLNMEDACVVVNYDLPSGADELFQRAGRILRMTSDPDRIIHVYTFLPNLQNEATRVGSDVKTIIAKLEERHDSSRDIIGGSILPRATPTNAPTEIRLARAEDIAALEEALNSPDDALRREPDAVLVHASNYERHKNEVANLDLAVHTAKNFSGSEPILFLLLQYEASPPLMLAYHMKTGKINRPSAEVALDWLMCKKDPNEKARVSAAEVEEASQRAVAAWCAEESGRDLDLCSRVCSVYLQPANEQETRRIWHVPTEATATSSPPPQGAADTP